MPCLNEEKTLGMCISKAQACFTRLGVHGEVVVADNGSTDGSVAIAESLGARVVHVPIKGYGAAVSAGARAAYGRIIIMGDSDDSYDWSNLDAFIEAVEAGNELVMGNRFRGGIEPGAMPPLHRYLGNPVLSFISKIAFRIPIGDFHCGMRAFSADAFRRMRLSANGMEFATEMVASASRIGLKVSEIPIKLYPDKRGRPPHLRSFRDGWRHLRFILSHSPDHLFVWPGLSLFALGSILMGLLVSGPVTLGGQYLGVHFIVLGAMMALIGTNIVSMGVLGKVILGIGPPDRSSFLRGLLAHPHQLELTLLAGAVGLLAGLVVDAALLLRWLETESGMEDSVHLAIVASTVIVISLEVMFSAFLLFLARVRLDEARRSTDIPDPLSSLGSLGHPAASRAADAPAIEVTRAGS
ncbi:MAG: glycosyltransferase family 2 protein [Pseudomonadota bacterium]